MAAAGVDISLRLTMFFGVFAAVALAELRWPRRPLACSRWQRWPSNLTLVVLNTLLLRWIVPWTAVEVALAAGRSQWGLLHWLALPELFAWVLAITLLDLTIYWQHVLFHRLPLFWRLHRMHHTDLDLDVTSGTRFHTLEMILSMAVKCTVVVLIGAPAGAVLTFELLLNATAMFNHGNVWLPERWDRRLRRVLVTPDFHRLHHSTDMGETNSNFGFNLTCWDYLFKTYRATPQSGSQAAIELGVHGYRSVAELRLDRLLLQPFRPIPGP